MSQNHIPKTMTAAVLEAYNDVESLRIVQRPVPKPGPNQVLVKVAASPINPSDLMFLEGSYGFKKPLPVVPGFEGSGIVVGVGSGMMGRFLAGKRVACVVQDKEDGVWAEYMVTNANYALPLDNAVDLEQGAMSVVNPLTAVALIDIAKKAGHKTVINTAAASVLGQMMIRLGQNEGIQVINIVRRQSQVDLLKQQGAFVVLNSSRADFAQQLRDVCHQHNARLAFDAIAGNMPQTLLEAMPDHSKVTIYGRLSEDPTEVMPNQFIFQKKSIDGFWLTAWIGQKSFLQSLLVWRQAQKLMLTTLKTDVRAKYKLQDIRQAVTDYQNQMTGGKALIIMES